MTQEERQLLLKDLCARLLYNPYCHVEGLEEPVRLIKIGVNDVDGILLLFDYEINGLLLEVYLSEVKPYLRPMSSMTEEEKKKLFSLCTFAECSDWEGKVTELYVIEIASRYDPTHNSDNSFKIWGVDIRAIYWLNEHHFDYLQLIESGLALEAPEGMYNT